MRRRLPALPPALDLPVRLLAGAAAALALVLVLRLAQIDLALPLPLALGIVAGAVSWALAARIERAEALDVPRPDLEADYALPHAQDTRVRRLEDMVHGAQPRRRMTGRALGQVLAELVAEHDRDPDAPPLSAELRRLTAGGGEDDSVLTVDRRTLHHHLRELAAGEEKDR